jgi:hypothetical protein
LTSNPIVFIYNTKILGKGDGERWKDKREGEGGEVDRQKGRGTGRVRYGIK